MVPLVVLLAKLATGTDRALGQQVCLLTLHRVLVDFLRTKPEAKFVRDSNFYISIIWVVFRVVDLPQPGPSSRSGPKAYPVYTTGPSCLRRIDKTP